MIERDKSMDDKTSDDKKLLIYRLQEIVTNWKTMQTILYKENDANRTSNLSYFVSAGTLAHCIEDINRLIEENTIE